MQTTVKLSILATLIFLASSGYATVYIYDVTTASNRFYTASKLQPDTFLKYNGGYDVIYRLNLVATYKDSEYDNALKDYNLDGKNINNNQLFFLPVAPNIQREPYYWWR